MLIASVDHGPFGSSNLLTPHTIRTASGLESESIGVGSTVDVGVVVAVADGGGVISFRALNELKTESASERKLAQNTTRLTTILRFNMHLNSDFTGRPSCIDRSTAYRGTQRSRLRLLFTLKT
jgi:hypothetical protein